ncbi:retrotransposon protein, putative, ty1-copia subclass [Tanacetum coccineum]
MALRVQNINHSAFMSMFEREKLSRANFNDWFRLLKLVLRVEKKMFVIEQPIPPAPPTYSEYLRSRMRYMIHNDVAYLMLGSMKQAGMERFDLIQTFYACIQEEGKPVGQYVLKMKGYVEQLERLGYALPQDHMGELHAMLIEYEKGLPKKAETPQVMMIKGGKIQKANKKSRKAKGKEHPTKDDACHHCKEVGHYNRNGPAYLVELIKKKKQVGTASSSDNVSTKRAKHNLDSTYLWHCHLAHISKKRIEKLQHDGLLKSTDDKSFDQCVSCLSAMCQEKMLATSLPFTNDYSRYGYVYLLKHKHDVFETFKVFKNEVENQLGKTIKALRSDRLGEYISQEFKDYLKACGIVQQLTPPYTPQHNGVSERRNRTTLPLSFWDYALESATRILNMVPTKKVDKTPYELWYGKIPNLSYLKVWDVRHL